MATTETTETMLTIGVMATRAGVSTATLRYYEAEGLITAERSAGNQRRYRRSTLRRVGVIRAGRAVGMSIDDLRGALAALPNDRAPTRADWDQVAARWQGDLEERIVQLQRLRDRLTGCIGCGCLSLTSCALFNPDDGAAGRGVGARYLLGDDPPPAAGVGDE